MHMQVYKPRHEVAAFKVDHLNIAEAVCRRLDRLDDAVLDKHGRVFRGLHIFAAVKDSGVYECVFHIITPLMPTL